jgi:hypothetical protein
VTEPKEEILKERAGEIACDVSVRLFLNRKRFIGVEEWTSMDVLMDLSRIFQDSKGIVLRSILKGYNFPNLKGY